MVKSSAASRPRVKPTASAKVSVRHKSTNGDRAQQRHLSATLKDLNDRIDQLSIKTAGLLKRLS